MESINVKRMGLFVFAGESVVPEQTNKTQENATRGRSQSAASSGSQQQEQPPRHEVETGDSGTRDGRQ
jgi:hypothetical protein